MDGYCCANDNHSRQQRSSNVTIPYNSERGADSTNWTDRSLLIRIPVIKSGVVTDKNDNTEKPLCRICFRGSSLEDLVSPCKCRGSVGFVHLSCLEKWLGSRDCETCELCKYHFLTVRKPRGFWDWCHHPESSIDRRNFIGDLVCFLILTPLGLASFWLCVQGAIHYQHLKNATWETAALTALAVFLVLAYGVWICLSVRYHYLVWCRWRQHNWDVHIIDVREDADDHLQHILQNQQNMVEMVPVTVFIPPQEGSVNERATIVPEDNISIVTHQPLPEIHSRSQNTSRNTTHSFTNDPSAATEFL